jgi:hypothetical protein
VLTYCYGYNWPEAVIHYSRRCLSLEGLIGADMGKYMIYMKIFAALFVVFVEFLRKLLDKERKSKIASRGCMGVLFDV